jgi:hypothetical protein
MDRGLKAKTLFTMVLSIGLSVFIAYSASSAGEIDRIKLKPEQMPGGWKLVKEFRAPEKKIKLFETRFVAPIDEVLNQKLKVDGKAEVQVNYLASPTEEGADLVYQGMIEMVGAANVIVRKGKVAIEIISSDNRLKDKVVDLLELPTLQKRKLKVTDLPENWLLARELTVSGPELEGFEKRFGAKFEGILNQFFLVDRQRLRINYIAGSTEQDAQVAYRKLIELVGKVNMVVRKDKIVMEIITSSDELKEKAKQVLSDI